MTGNLPEGAKDSGDVMKRQTELQEFFLKKQKIDDLAVRILKSLNFGDEQIEGIFVKDSSLGKRVLGIATRIINDFGEDIKIDRLAKDEEAILTEDLIEDVHGLKQAREGEILFKTGNGYVFAISGLKKLISEKSEEGTEIVPKDRDYDLADPYEFEAFLKTFVMQDSRVRFFLDFDLEEIKKLKGEERYETYRKHLIDANRIYAELADDFLQYYPEHQQLIENHKKAISDLIDTLTKKDFSQLDEQIINMYDANGKLSFNLTKINTQNQKKLSYLSADFNKAVIGYKMTFALNPFLGGTGAPASAIMEMLDEGL